jgi:hypothetical protein
MELRGWVVAALWLGWAVPAEAHFLFVRILPAAEGGRAAEVYFSELAQAGDTRFIDKIAQTQLWLQQTPGTFTPLAARKAPDRLRAWVPATGSLLVVGQCEYGVLARPKQTAFLLRHFPKAIAGNPEEINRLKPYGKLPLEVVATVESAAVRFTALKDGKPVPQANFVTVDASLTNVELTADAAGVATWQPPAQGVYSVYTRDTRKEAGAFKGQKYEEIRDFATVAFSWPLERKDADPEAVALFEEAVAARAQWHDFPGFSAVLHGNLDGRTFAGSVTVTNKGAATYVDDDASQEESVSGWVQEQLDSLVLHRLARPASERRPVLRLAEPKDPHPLGRLLVFDGGKFAASYRVRNRQITVVNRHLGKENMTITVLENDKNPEGRFLPRDYVVQYWDAATGKLARTEAVQNTWLRLGQWDLPVRQSVTTASDAGLAARQFTLSKHELGK